MKKLIATLVGEGNIDRLQKALKTISPSRTLYAGLQVLNADEPKQELILQLLFETDNIYIDLHDRYHKITVLHNAIHNPKIIRLLLSKNANPITR